MSEIRSLRAFLLDLIQQKRRRLNNDHSILRNKMHAKLRLRSEIPALERQLARARAAVEKQVDQAMAKDHQAVVRELKRLDHIRMSILLATPKELVVIYEQEKQR